MTTVCDVHVMDAQENVPVESSGEIGANGAYSISSADNGGKFTRSIVENLGDKVRRTDRDEENDLDLFCYVRCTSNDDEVLRNCRGVVFNGDKIVMKAFPFPLEFSDKDIDDIEKTVAPVFQRCSVYDAHEGALIRMFHFNGKWFMTTHRKLNAFRSKWASKESFGTSFKRALESEMEVNTAFREKMVSIEDGSLLEKFQSTLDTDKQYMFLVCNTSENRIVCMPPARPTMYHVGTFVNGNLSMDIDCGIPYPRKHVFLSLDEMYVYLENLNCAEIQGVILFAPDNTQYKIVNQKYQELFRARGNEPSIKFRYLQVRMNWKLSQILFWLYPELTDVFEDYENSIYEISKTIYRAYVNRFIQKKHITVPKEEFAVMRECHEWHLQDRTNNLMTQEKVLEIVNMQPATNVNHMIRRFRTEQTKKNNTQNSIQNRIRSNTVTSDVEEVDVPKRILVNNQ